MISLESVIRTTLVAIYGDDFFTEKIFLKGGQALRFSENILDRLSTDADFSSKGGLIGYISEAFFQRLENVLKEEFFKRDLVVFDFKEVKKPKIKPDGLPDFFTGWQVTFKLIEKSKSNLSLVEKQRNAIIPEGSSTSKISIDISEYEYCDSIEKIEIDGSIVQSYSRVLLLLEKIRSICQQHSSYPYTGNTPRPRDFYDIERLWAKAINSGKPDVFIQECKVHIEHVFKAKDVEMGIINTIFEPESLDLHRRAWTGLVFTADAEVKEFDYYVQTLQYVISLIFSKD